VAKLLYTKPQKISEIKYCYVHQESRGHFLKHGNTVLIDAMVCELVKGKNWCIAWLKVL
jgi:hypothetical protein